MSTHRPPCVPAGWLLGIALGFVGILPACAGPEADDGSSTFASPEGEERVCYFEYRASYTCADGDGDPGVWEATCSGITEEACGGPDFVDTHESIDGCIFSTEFRSVDWLPQSECDARLPGGGSAADDGTPGDAGDGADDGTPADSGDGGDGGDGADGADDGTTGGSTGPTCGDGSCDADESCEGCPADCGSCGQLYGACSDSAQCGDQTETCVMFETGWMCSTSCGDDFDCPAPADSSTHAFCAIPYDIYFCVIDCTAGGTCPGGTACYVQQDGRGVCL